MILIRGISPCRLRLVINSVFCANNELYADCSVFIHPRFSARTNLRAGKTGGIFRPSVSAVFLVCRHILNIVQSKIDALIQEFTSADIVNSGIFVYSFELFRGQANSCRFLFILLRNKNFRHIIYLHVYNMCRHTRNIDSLSDYALVCVLADHLRGAKYSWCEMSRICSKAKSIHWVKNSFLLMLYFSAVLSIKSSFADSSLIVVAVRVYCLGIKFCILIPSGFVVYTYCIIILLLETGIECLVRLMAHTISQIKLCFYNHQKPFAGSALLHACQAPRASGRFHNTWTARSPGGVPAVRFSRFAGTTPGKSAQSPGAGASRRPRPPLKPQPRAGEGLIPPPRSSALFLRRVAVPPLPVRPAVSPYILLYSTIFAPAA